MRRGPDGVPGGRKGDAQIEEIVRSVTSKYKTAFQLFKQQYQFAETIHLYHKETY